MKNTTAQNLRERKGAFFTPSIWVQLSQKYIADVLGKNWQEKYCIWDCAAGNGNLLVGLSNTNHLWASTLDEADVKMMHERIGDDVNLLQDHVFPFDFLNDDFSKLPQGLQNIINDEHKRRKLVLYINPPYAEAGTTATRLGTKKNKTGVATGNKICVKNSDRLGKAKNEIYTQFLARIYVEIPGCVIAEFSTQKALIAPNFNEFRKFFRAQLKKCFIVPAQTFDFVKGQFPIGFKVWDTKKKTQFTQADIDVYDAQASYLGKKTFGTRHKCAYINDWMKQFRSKSPACAKLCYVSNNFQNNIKVRVCSAEQKIFAHDVIFNITKDNLLLASIYFSVRKCIEATWLNDRDQFFFPNDGWKIDREFQSDCLTYTLFSNNIQTKYGINHWIPFIESDVQSPREFESHFMTDFILDKGLIFSSEAKAVFDAGRELWRYYLSLPNANINTSLYSIREHFQGRSAKGTMNARNDDITYTLLIGKVRSALKTLSTKIAPKVYEFGFLKK